MEIHLQSNPNPNTSKESQDMILDIFWKESDHETGLYRYCSGMFLHPDELNCNSDVCHHLYLLPFTCFIDFLPAELPQKVRSWVTGEDLVGCQATELWKTV